MPAPVIKNPPGADTSVSEADRAAEALLKNPSNEFKSEVTPERESVLDEAFASAAPDPVASDGKDLGRENGGVKKPLEGAPAAEPAKAADPAPAPDSKPAEPAPVASDPNKPKSFLDDVLGKDAPPPVAEDPTDKAFADVKLRSDASDKTKESFENLRTISKGLVATERANAEKIRAELDTLKQQFEEAQKKLGTLPPETEAELKELREFRALRDVENRPEIKERFDKRINENVDAVFSQLKAAGLSAELETQLRALPEKERNDYFEKHIYPKLDSSERRFIEAKLLDNINTGHERRKALDAAKADAGKILAEQGEAPKRAANERLHAIANLIKPVALRLSYLQVKEIPATATATEKSAIEAENTFALGLQESLKRAIIEDTPEVRAELALAVPILKYTHRELQSYKARAEAAEKKLKAIEDASNTGHDNLGRRSPPPVSNAPAPAPKQAQDSEDTIDALFKIANGNRPTG